MPRATHDAHMADGNFAASAFPWMACLKAVLDREGWVSLFLVGATLRCLNYLRTNHASCGDVLPTPQVKAFTAILGMGQNPPALSTSAWNTLVTYAMYHTFHALDSVTFARCCVPELMVPNI